MAEKQKKTEKGNCKMLYFKENAITAKFVSKVCRYEEKWEKLEKKNVFAISRNKRKLQH